MQKGHYLSYFLYRGPIHNIITINKSSNGIASYTRPFMYIIYTFSEGVRYK